MPKLSEYKVKPWPNVLCTGDSGAGKSTFIGHGPQPSAWLLIDKDSPTIIEGVDPDVVFFKTYPPADVDLTKKDYLPPRNVADDLIQDLQAIKNHFVSIMRGKPQPLKIKMMDGAIEEWPTPAMLVLEGAAPTSHQSANRILHMNDKHAIEDFGNKLRFYDTRLQFLTNLYDMLLRLPCVVCVSTWGETDKTSQKVDGKVELIDTGIIQPRFGGQLNDLIPGKFDSSFYFFVKNGFHYALTKDDDKHKGYKIGNIIGLPSTLPMTIKTDEKTKTKINPCADLWKLLLQQK